MENGPANFEQLVSKTFEKHDIKDTALQNALTEILKETFSSSKQESSSSDVLSEKLRDEPRNE